MSKYYYIDEITKQQQGPFPLNDLQNKKIRPETMVWRSGMPDWAKAGSLDELAFLFNTQIPIPQPEQKKTEKPPLNITHDPQPQAPSSHAYSQRQYYNEERKWNDILPVPKNWLIESILLTIFCCSPISAVGIYFASKVESLYYSRDFEGATRASLNARNWALAGILFLPACYALFFVFALIIGVLF